MKVKSESEVTQSCPTLPEDKKKKKKRNEIPGRSKRMCKIFGLYKMAGCLEDVLQFNMNVMTNDSRQIDMNQIMRHLQQCAKEFGVC